MQERRGVRGCDWKVLDRFDQVGACAGVEVEVEPATAELVGGVAVVEKLSHLFGHKVTEGTMQGIDPTLMTVKGLHEVQVWPRFSISDGR